MIHKILIIDDEDHIRATIRQQLAGLEYEILEADDGEQGIALLNTLDNPLTIDVIICDVRMPRINGVEAAAYFHKEYPSTPLIILTGYPDAKLAADFLRQGAVEYLTKPVDQETLIEAVQSAAHKRKMFGRSRT